MFLSPCLLAFEVARKMGRDAGATHTFAVRHLSRRSCTVLGTHMRLVISSESRDVGHMAATAKTAGDDSRAGFASHPRQDQTNAHNNLDTDYSFGTSMSP